MKMSRKMNNDTKILGVKDGIRQSTKDLLYELYDRLDEGCKSFDIEASGQHDIGGPLWTNDGSELNFNVKNPGQRVGSMGLPGTNIVIEGSAPADVGWLNAGAEIVLKGDGGDTTAHCAANGKIYVGGRVGTRSGALMKYDPSFTPPEFWVLRNTGSFSFEFMGGGIAVVCGYGCDDMKSIIGDRSCIGMVGGTVYVRGNVGGLSNDVWVMELDENDKEFLLEGIPVFLSKIDKKEIEKELTDMSQWKKIVAKTYAERTVKSFMPMKQFRTEKWEPDGGIFGDVMPDDFYVADFVERQENRLREPEWLNAQYSAPCEYNCPIFIPTQKRIALLRNEKTAEALKLVLDFSPFPASVCGQVCPNLCMDECTRLHVDIPVKIKELGMLSKDINVDWDIKENGKKIGVIGAGSAGLGAAWHLRKLGYTVDVFEADDVIGGKLRQVIPEERLAREVLESELKRIKDIGVNIETGVNVDKKKFKSMCDDYEAVVLAIGAHTPVVIPFEGHERLVKGLDFLKDVNNGENPKVGEKVVVIGAYQMGAKKVTAIDIQKPAAFDHEIEHAKKLGAEILWPRFTQKVTEEGVVLKDGTLIPADTVIISVGDRPDYSMLDRDYMDEKGVAKLNEYLQSEVNPKVFIPGDATKLGLFTHAIGDGRKVALNIDNMLNGKELDAFRKAPMIPQDKVKDEFYHPMNNQRVEEMTADDETKRCMSCGFCRDCGFCMDICPEQAINRTENENGFEYISDPKKCIGCGICAGVCPCGVWTMHDNLQKYMEG